MILKYRTPKEYERIFNSETVYCKILDRISVDDEEIYLVKQLNNGKRTFIFNENELRHLNIFDWIRLLKFRRNKNGSKSKSI